MLTSCAAVRKTAILAGVRLRCIRSRMLCWSETFAPGITVVSADRNAADRLSPMKPMLPLSAPIKADKAGRPLPRYQSNSYTLGNSEVLLMSDVSATSFDGRYFGPINRSQVQTVIRPVITW